MVVGLQVLVRVTAPCFLKKATGMNTAFAPDCGTRRIQPKYWPLGSLAAEIVIGKVSSPPFATFSGRLLVPTVMVAPSGAETSTVKRCLLPETFRAVRDVVTVPVIVVASM